MGSETTGAGAVPLDATLALIGLLLATTALLVSYVLRSIKAAVDLARIRRMWHASA